MRIAMHVCPTKFLYARRKLPKRPIRILDIGCGNNSPSTTKNWFPGCHYSGADIQEYNLNSQDLAAMDDFFLLGIDGSGYDAIPNASYDLILMHHVIEHMPDAAPLMTKICAKLAPGGYIWIAFPSLRSLALPPATPTLHFCDDDTHVHLPDVREVANMLFASGIKVVHGGRSHDLIRAFIGLAILPQRFLGKLLTGKLNGKGLWYILGFEDHVFGRRPTA